uniref:Putative secreted protein n=1 Tax=Ixodes ricinus TaxID=34613 RepID=A0A6B0U8X6_IXORI
MLITLVLTVTPQLCWLWVNRSRPPLLFRSREREGNYVRNLTQIDPSYSGGSCHVITQIERRWTRVGFRTQRHKTLKARSHSCDRVRPRETRPVFRPVATA